MTGGYGMSRQRYRLNTGLNYPVKGKEVRAEAGDVVDDIPAKSVRWLLDRGHIELVGPTGDGDESEQVADSDEED